MRTKEETTQFGFRMPNALRLAIEEEATKNERTISQQIIFELRKNHPVQVIGGA